MERKERPTRHGVVNIKYVICADPDCNNEVRITPCQKNKKYCSPACAYKKASLPKKYKAEDIAFIIANIATMHRAELAAKYKSSVSTFNRMMCELREKGHAIPVIPRAKGSTTKLPAKHQKYIKTNLYAMSAAVIAKNLGADIKPVTSLFNYLRKKDRDANPDKTGKRVAAQQIDRRKIPKAAQTAHRDRKPVVVATIKRNERLPDRKINEEGCIKVVFKDKNKTTFNARDEEHAAKIREKYAYLEKPYNKR